MAKVQKQAKPAPKVIRKTPEELLREYFLNQDMPFLYKEKKVDFPIGSAHQFAIPDFYLPKHQLPVEYMHHWEDPKFRPKNLAKLEAYAQADIPCIFIYPQDLLNLDKLFPQKLFEAQKHLAFKQRDAGDIKFSLTIAVLCILLGVPLSLIKYTKYLGWIAIAYGAVLLLMRHPHLVLRVLKQIGVGLLIGLRYAGKGLGIFLKAVGKGAARLIVLLARGFVILCKTLWKLTQLFAIYTWIAIKALAHALWWIGIHLWYGILTVVLWLWHISLKGGYAFWRALRKLAHYAWIGLLYFGRGILFVLRAVWRGLLMSFSAFGAGVYRAKVAVQEKAKERRILQQQAAKAKREEEREAKVAAREAAKPKKSKVKPAKKGKRKAA